jgi:carbon monoxide dehydrogenase subunit G
MFKKIAIVVGVLIAGVLGLAMTKPDSFNVQRTTKIKAPPDKIFPLINDFNNWGSWSPWEKVDPAMKRTHSGAASGKGAVYEWDGNSKVGKGRMEITDASAPSKVTIKLDFLKPMEGHDTAEFTLAPEGDSTNVTWAMRGPAPFISKVMQVFISMDSMLGKEFDTGLANMKSAAEK